MQFKSGFIAILGIPNAGKSTLLNRLVGEKLAIVTPKPQTTRHNIKGILTTENYQLIFVDTPGIIEPRDKFNVTLMETAEQALEGIDIIYHLVDITSSSLLQEKPLLSLIERLPQKLPKFLVLNKIDLLPEPTKAVEQIPDFINRDNYVETVAISAATGENVPTLIELTLKYLPEGPLYYDAELVTDREERFLVAEIVREKIYELTGEEIPYAVATMTDEFREQPDGKHYIRVVIYVEKESQKPIVIGKGGELIKRIGQAAREEIEQLLEHPVYLELWVKVAKNWRRREFDLRRFGYLPIKQPPKTKQRG